MENYIKFLAEESDRGKLVVFVGAGVSKNCKLPDWNELIIELGKQLNIEEKKYTNEEILIIPEIFYEKFGKIRYYEILENIFKVKMEPHKIHEKLEELELDYVITTNYDNLIEKQLNKFFSYDVIKKDEELAYSQSNKMIIKMHGDLSTRNIVLKKSDYDEYEEKFPLITTYVKSLFTTNTILFIGYSLNDINVKNIMKWISEILKDNFRKVYLVDFEDGDILKRYEDKNNRLVNRISLIKREDEKHGEVLANFLDSIIKEKQKINENLKGKLYKELSYLTDGNLKKTFKKNEIKINQYNWSEKNSIIKKSINLKVENKNTLKEIQQLINSGVERVNGEPIDLFFSNYLEVGKLKTGMDEEENIINGIFTYDFQMIKNLEIKKIESSTKYLLIYSYINFKEFGEARRLLEEISEETNNKELKVWNRYIESLIQREEQGSYIIDKDSRKIELEKIYKSHFRKLNTDLYAEIFDSYTFTEVKDEMDKLLNKIKNGKNTTFLAGLTDLEKAKILIRDFFNFSMINGLFLLGYSEIKTIIRKYFEIILVAYTNDIDKENNIFGIHGKVNKIEEIEYFEIYLLINLPSKDLVSLLNEYEIKKINCTEESIETLKNALKNLLSVSNPLKMHLIDNYLIILSKIEFSKENMDSIVNILIETEALKFLSAEGIKGLTQFIDKNSEKLSEMNLSDFIKKMINTKNAYLSYSGENLINFLTFQFKEKKIPKLKLDDVIEDFCEMNFSNNEKTKMKLYFTRVSGSEFTEKVKIEAIKNLDEKLDINLYYLMLNLEILSPTSQYEDKIFETLNETYSRDNIEYVIKNKNKYLNLVLKILNLNTGEFGTEDFVSRMKNYKNEYLERYLREIGIKNVWEYYINKEKYNIVDLKAEDFEYLTEKGIMKILNENSKNNEFISKIKEILSQKYSDNLLNAFLKF